MKRLTWMLLLAAVVGLAPMARAQGDDEMDLLGSNWDLRIGVFIPESGVARDAKGDVWFTAGAEKRFYTDDRYVATLSIDYYGRDTMYNVPVMLNVRATTNRLRYGAGVGLGLSHDLEGGVTGLTWNLLVGYTLVEGTNPIFADLRYLGHTTGSGLLDGWALTVGRSF